MNYDIRYRINELVDLVDDERGYNPWRVVCIFIHGDGGIIDEKYRVSYNLISHNGEAGRGAYNHEICPHAAPQPRMHKIYVSDPDIVAMVKEMTPEERDRLALKFESFLGWNRGDGPGVRFEVVEDE